MGIQFTPDQRRLFLVLTGMEPPKLDPDRLRGVADGFSEVLGLLGSLPDDLVRTVGRVRSQFSGAAADAFEQSMAAFVSGPANYVGAAREAAGSVAKYARSAATSFEYAVYMAIGQIVQLMIEIIWCIVNAFRTFGLSLTLIPVYRAIASLFLRKLLRFLITHLTAHMVIELGVSLALDLLIQRVQIGRGTREGIDGNLTREAAIGGALGGLFSAAGAAAVNRLIKGFRHNVSEMTRLAVLDQLTTPRTTTGAGPGVVAKAFSDDLGALVTRHQEHLLATGATKSGAGLSDAAVTALARDFGDLFAEHLAPRAGQQSARELGTAYGQVFAGNWGRSDIAEALTTVLTRAGTPEMDSAVRTVLTQLPDTVLNAARSQHRTLKGTLASLGLDSITSGLTEYIAGLFSGLATTGKIDATAFGFIAGTLNSAITNVSVTGGITSINTLKNLTTHPQPTTEPAAPVRAPVLQPVPSTTDPSQLTQPAPAEDHSFPDMVSEHAAPLTTAAPPPPTSDPGQTTPPAPTTHAPPSPAATPGKAVTDHPYTAPHGPTTPQPVATTAQDSVPTIAWPTAKDPVPTPVPATADPGPQPSHPTGRTGTSPPTHTPTATPPNGEPSRARTPSPPPPASRTAHKTGITPHRHSSTSPIPLPVGGRNDSATAPPQPTVPQAHPSADETEHATTHHRAPEPAVLDGPTAVEARAGTAQTASGYNEPPDSQTPRRPQPSEYASPTMPTGGGLRPRAEHDTATSGIRADSTRPRPSDDDPRHPVTTRPATPVSAAGTDHARPSPREVVEHHTDTAVVTASLIRPPTGEPPVRAVADGATPARTTEAGGLARIVNDIRAQYDISPDVNKCVDLLNTFRARLYPEQEITQASRRRPTAASIRAHRALDDTVLGTGRVEELFGPGANWHRFGSWTDLASLVSQAGKRATALVLLQRRTGLGHAYALHNEGGTVKTVNLTAANDGPLSDALPLEAPAQARAIVLDASGWVLPDSEMSKIAPPSLGLQALTDPPSDPRYGANAFELETSVAVHMGDAQGGVVLASTPHYDLVTDVWRGLPVIEIVSRPFSALRGEAGWNSRRETAEAVAAVYGALGGRSGRTTLKRIARDFPGMRLTAAGESMSIGQEASPGRMSLQFTVGISPTQLLGLARFLDDPERVLLPSHDANRHRLSAQSFSRLTRLDFESAHLGTRHEADIVEGWAWLVYTQTASLAHQQLTGADLSPKSYASVVSRVSLSTQRGMLPDRVRRFFKGQRNRLEVLFNEQFTEDNRDHIREINSYLESPIDVLSTVITNSESYDGAPIRRYFRSALERVTPSADIDQSVLDLHTYMEQADNNFGERTPEEALGLYELRLFGRPGEMPTVPALRQYLSELEGMTSRLDEYTVLPGSDVRFAATSALVTFDKKQHDHLDPAQREEIQQFAEQAVEQIRRQLAKQTNGVVIYVEGGGGGRSATEHGLTRAQTVSAELTRIIDAQLGAREKRMIRIAPLSRGKGKSSIPDHLWAASKTDSSENKAVVLWTAVDAGIDKQPPLQSVAPIRIADTSDSMSRGLAAVAETDPRFREYLHQWRPRKAHLSSGPDHPEVEQAVPAGSQAGVSPDHLAEAFAVQQRVDPASPAIESGVETPDRSAEDLPQWLMAEAAKVYQRVRPADARIFDDKQESHAASEQYRADLLDIAHAGHLAAEQHAVGLPQPVRPTNEASYNALQAALDEKATQIAAAYEAAIGVTGSDADRARVHSETPAVSEEIDVLTQLKPGFAYQSPSAAASLKHEDALASLSENGLPADPSNRATVALIGQQFEHYFRYVPINMVQIDPNFINKGQEKALVKPGLSHRGRTNARLILTGSTNRLANDQPAHRLSEALRTTFAIHATSGLPGDAPQTINPTSPRAEHPADPHNPGPSTSSARHIPHTLPQDIPVPRAEHTPAANNAHREDGDGTVGGVRTRPASNAPDERAKWQALVNPLPTETPRVLLADEVTPLVGEVTDAALSRLSRSENRPSNSGELFGSGIVETDRWRPISRTIDPFVWLAKPGGQRVVRAPKSGERVQVRYAWEWFVSAPDHSSVLSMTRRIYLSPGHGADDRDLMKVRSAATHGLEYFVNDRRHHLPALQPDVHQAADPEKGPLLQVRVDFVDSPEGADSRVQVNAGMPTDRLPMTQDVWFSDVHPVAYVHEIMHGIGVMDDYRANWSNESIMGSLRGTDPSIYSLTSEHLQQIMDVLMPYVNNNARTSEFISRPDDNIETTHEIDRAPSVDYRLVHRSEQRDIVESRPGESLWHFSTQPPEQVFREGFNSRDPENIIRAREWTTQNAWSQFVATTRDRDLWFMNRRYRYEIEPWRSFDPTGVDILATLGNQGGGALATESEIAFVGRIDAAALVRVTDRETGKIGTWDAQSATVVWARRRMIEPVYSLPENTVIGFPEGGSKLTLASMRQIATLAQNVLAHAVTSSNPRAAYTRVKICGHGKGRLLTKSNTSARRAQAVQEFFQDRVNAELYSLGTAASEVTPDRFRITATDHGNAVDPSVQAALGGSESLRIAVIRVHVELDTPVR
ncbi:hypothetical protein [Streptomyces sp. ADI93-02]|uniref:WXG100 family type VII secretion target n=1 Tax=Streptomyces sp. ADI93-02 TaxID=1522757 RepID=UPI000F557475|nr:hypothetical protein [Streptomyces sp. ADI93-02]RPK33555.1 hypothetical protein EES40_35595 [Streptomyces sp. ADI93-02]